MQDEDHEICGYVVCSCCSISRHCGGFRLRAFMASEFFTLGSPCIVRPRGLSSQSVVALAAFNPVGFRHHAEPSFWDVIGQRTIAIPLRRSRSNCFAGSEAEGMPADPSLSFREHWWISFLFPYHQLGVLARQLFIDDKLQARLSTLGYTVAQLVNKMPKAFKELNDIRAKLDAKTGNAIWVLTAGDEKDQKTTDVAVTSAGIAVAGTFTGSLDIANGSGLVQPMNNPTTNFYQLLTKTLRQRVRSRCATRSFAKRLRASLTSSRLRATSTPTSTTSKRLWKALALRLWASVLPKATIAQRSCSTGGQFPIA